MLRWNTRVTAIVPLAKWHCCVEISSEWISSVFGAAAFDAPTFKALNSMHRENRSVFIAVRLVPQNNQKEELFLRDDLYRVHRELVCLWIGFEILNCWVFDDFTVGALDIGGTKLSGYSRSLPPPLEALSVAEGLFRDCGSLCFYGKFKWINKYKMKHNMQGVRF